MTKPSKVVLTLYQWSETLIFVVLPTINSPQLDPHK